MVHTLVADDGCELPDKLSPADGILRPYLPFRFSQLFGRGLEHVADTASVYLATQFLEIYHRRQKLGCGAHECSDDYSYATVVTWAAGLLVK